MTKFGDGGSISRIWIEMASYDVVYWNGWGPQGWAAPAPGEDPQPWADTGTVLSLGGGVDSWAMLLLLHDPEAGQEILDTWTAHKPRIDASWKPDLVLFAETGNEWPETYDFLYEVVTPFCEEHEIPFFRIKRRTKYEHLYHEVVQRGTVPYMHGAGSHSCSSRWKVDPQVSFKQALFPKGCVELIGYTCDEKRNGDRHGQEKPYSKSEDAPIRRAIYPMRILGLTREDEMFLTRRMGRVVPPKSACWFCPSMKAHEIERLYNEHPELWEKVIHLEDEFRRVAKRLGRKEWGGRFTKGLSMDSWENGKRLWGSKSVREFEAEIVGHHDSPAFEDRENPSFEQVFAENQAPLPLYDIPESDEPRRISLPVLPPVTLYDFEETA